MVTCKFEFSGASKTFLMSLLPFNIVLSFSARFKLSIPRREQQVGWKRGRGTFFEADTLATFLNLG